jgi:LEA14-like dessication related protein
MTLGSILGSRLARALVVGSLVGSSLAASGCSKPKAPQLTPQEARVVAVDMNGFDMRVKMDAFNPNGLSLSVRAVAAHVVVDGNQDLGTVTSSTPFDLPANAHTALDVPMRVKWKGIGGLAAIAAAKRPVPYVVDGTATVGGENLNLDVPFKLQGVLTADQLQQAAVKSLQNIPGLEGLPGLLPPR